MMPPLPPPSRARALRRRPWPLALAVLLVSLGGTLTAWRGARRSQELRDFLRVARFVGRTELNLQNRLGRYEDLVRSVQGLFLDDRMPSPEVWRAFVQRLDLPTRHPGVTSLAFVAPVPPGELEAYLRARPHLRGRYHLPAADAEPLLEPGQHGDHLIIELCDPMPPGGTALGLDLGASHTRRLAAERARQTGRPALSGLTYFQRPSGRQEAVSFFMPIYGGPMRPTDGEARQRQFRGWVSAGILLQPLMEDILRGEDQGLALEIVDVFSARGPRWLLADPDWPAEGRTAQVRTLDAGGRGWQMRYAIKPAFYREGTRSLPLFVLLGGTVISLSLAALVWSLVGLRVRAADLARRMTVSLNEALARNRNHLENTPLAVIETDDRFRVREWNPAAERIFGYDREEILGRDPRLLIPPEEQDQVDLRRVALQAAPEGTRITMEILRRDGQRILCDWYNTALRDDAGRFLGAVFLADDVTERRRAEGALRQAQKLESLGVLTGGIAHDFNNLLTAILGNAEAALAAAGDQPRLRDALHRIEAASHRGADLARQMLAYAGKAHVSMRPLDLNAVIREMGDLLSVSLSKMVALRQDLAAGLPALEGDGAQLQQVVMNLVLNASEAIGDRPGTIALRTRAVRLDAAALAEAFPGQELMPGPYIRMEVEDDGCGMDADVLARIFDPFFSTKFTGRGLGLSAMLGIVRGHHGGLRVQSQPGRGTTFTLVFPASGAAVAPAPPPPPPPAPTTGTVLVVDDEPVLRDLARNALEAEGFVVREAQDGLEAVEIFERDRGAADLVLLDMTMPRMGGTEAFRRIRELAPGVRVLLTSGYTRTESMESLADLPPDGFLQKPFRIRDLVARVRELLAHPPDQSPG